MPGYPKAAISKRKNLRQERQRFPNIAPLPCAVRVSCGISQPDGCVHCPTKWWK